MIVLVLLVVMGMFAVSVILFPAASVILLVWFLIGRVVHRRRHRFDAFVGAMLS